MLQLSKKVEYALIALRHMAQHDRGQIFTAKEISKTYDVPYELLAKVLQKLARAGTLSSIQGVKGGYLLAKKASDIPIAQIIGTIEDEKPMITECYIDGRESCSIFDNCSIRKPLGKVQRNLNVLFQKMTIQEII
jgi:Rrf2 family protein